MKTTHIAVALLAAHVVCACSESVESSAPANVAQGGGAGTGGAGGSGTAGTGSAGTSTGGASGASGTVVVNEIDGHGDWFELFNTGSAAVDLSGWGVTDTGTDGKADVAGAMRLPSGTSLAAGGYLLIVGGHSAPPATPQTDCLMGGPATCFWASFKISASKGESLWLLGPTDVVVAEGNYPINATADSTVTWSRLPDGTGAFAKGKPTPGAANKAP